MNYLVTAGPTREFIDDIRYVSNLSSGRMGYALAAAAGDAGHDVILISGPCTLPAPAGAELISIVSADQMREAVLNSLPKADIIVMCAAVADYRPARRIPGKMKKGPDVMSLELVKTPDILAELGTLEAKKFLVGFALEAENALENARAKMASKKADMIVLNSPAAIGAETSAVQVLTPDGGATRIGPAAKEIIAAKLIKTIDSRFNEEPAQP